MHSIAYLHLDILIPLAFFLSAGLISFVSYYCRCVLCEWLQVRLTAENRNNRDTWKLVSLFMFLCLCC